MFDWKDYIESSAHWNSLDELNGIFFRKKSFEKVKYVQFFLPQLLIALQMKALQYLWFKREKKN